LIYREYGKTGVKLSVIGFGGMRFENSEDIETNASLVQSAYKAGINYFDTAPLYGNSEDIFGAAFKEMKKHRAEKPFYVSTKTNRENPSEARADLETSLQRMDLDYIDFYHVWCILRPDIYQRRKQNGILTALEKFQQEGLIKHICVSTHMTGADIENMLQDYPFDGILLGYSVMNFAYRELGIEAAHRLKRGVVVMNPLGGGIIPQHAERFDFARTQQAESVVEAALRFLINDERMTVALVGMGNQDHLKEAVRAADGFHPIPSGKIFRIRNRLKDGFNELCTGCRYCDDCPQGIPIPQLMDVYNHLLLNPDSFAIRLSLHWGLSLEEDYAARCTECGQCEENCTQQLPICDRLKKIREQVEHHLASQQK